MIVFTKSSSHSVFKNTRPGRFDTAELVFRGARGAYARAQIVLRDYEDFTVTGVTFSDFSHPAICRAENITIAYQDFVEYNDGTPYPDKLDLSKERKVLSQTSQSIWVNIRVPSGAAAGTCTFKATVHTSAGDFAVPASIRVYNVTVPEPKDGSFNLEYFLNYTSFPEKVKARWTPEWYEYLESYARSLYHIRNNCLDITLMPLLADAGSRRVSEDEWLLDFSRVDEFIDFMVSHSLVKKISIRSVIAVVLGRDVPYFDYDGTEKRVDYTDPLAEAWAKAYWGGIYKHFSETGRLGMLQLRLQDEPHYKDCWIWAREMCRKYAPGVICGEPLDTHEVAVELEGYCDQFIPRINVYEEGADFYKRMQAKGSEVWVYSCCFPEEAWYLNKFIDLPSRYSRLMTWACYSQGITGFLHWGYNYWSETGLYGTAKNARFKGDGFVVYPDEMGVIPSVRSYQTEDGIVDYELLTIAAKKFPAKAKALSLKVCRTFTDFEKSEDAFDAAVAELYELAELASV